MMDALFDFRGNFPGGFRAFGSFAEVAGRSLSKGPWLDTDGYVKFDGKVQYTPKDCPRYGRALGDNCGNN